MYAQAIVDDANEIKPDAQKPTPDLWYRRYAREYYEGTRELSLEDRGAYSDVLDLIYMTGGPLKDDERLIAHRLHIDVRTWRPIRKRLLALGKLFIVRGHLHNAKAKRVLSQRESERKSMGERPAKSAGSAVDRPRISRGSRPDLPGISLDLFENINEINGDSGPSSHNRTEEKREEREEKKDNIIPLRASRQQEDRLAGSGGVADLMIKDAAAWMHGDEKCAREWLTTQIAIYSEQIVRDSYAKLATDIASGKIITRPLQTWCTIAGRLHGAAGQAPAKTASQAGVPYKSARVAATEQARAIARKMAGGRKS